MTLAFRNTLPDDAYLLSGYTRERSDIDPDAEPLVGLDTIKKILESCPRGLEQRLQKLAAAIRRKGPRFGQLVELVRERDYPLGYAEDEEAFDLMIDTLESRGIIDRKSSPDGSVRVRLRAEHYEEQSGGSPGKSATAPHEPAVGVGRSPDLDIVLETRRNSGLYGVIWEGRQASLNRKVAIKIIRHSMQGVANAVAHALALARCSHENIVTVFQVASVCDPESGEVVDALVMEWLEGETLSARIGRERFSVQEARQIAEALLSGLRHLHAQGLTHGDLHPGNVVVTADRVKIIDVDYSKSCSLATLSPSAREERVNGDLSSLRYLLRTVAYSSALDARVIGAQESRLTAATALEDFQPIIEGLFSASAEQWLNRALPDAPGAGLTIATTSGGVDFDRIAKIRAEFESRVREGNFHGVKREGAAIALAIIPGQSTKIGDDVFSKPKRIRPPLANEWTHRVRGKSIVAMAKDRGEIRTAVELRTDGVIFAADAWSLDPFRWPTPRVVRPHVTDLDIIQTVFDNMELLDELGGLPPWAICVSFIEINGYRVDTSGWGYVLPELTEPDICADPIVLDPPKFPFDPKCTGELLAPALKFIWREFGYSPPAQ
jgi:tRNA A-37 threonylcarbamoyl transferase component Bud32